MRKKVSCRVIESVPLNQSGGGLFHTHPSKSQSSGFNTRSYQDVPAIMRVYFDPNPSLGRLNILA